MIRTTKKLVSGAAAAALSLSLLAAPALASTSIEISGNGAGSRNSASVKQSGSGGGVHQSNHANIHNSVHASSNTGGNSANRNTGGDVSIVTGDASTSVGISNHANSNFFGGGFGSFFNSHGGFKHMNRFLGNKVHTVLTGGQEVPGPGDPNGFGFATLKVRPNLGQVCVSMRVFNIDTATAAHIHEAATGVAGPVVVTLPTPNSSGVASGCVNADSSLLADIKANPADYYVNVHNVAYPSGAVRGQL